MASTSTQILIKNGLIVNHDGISQADILIEGEEIKKVAQNIQSDEIAEVIDARGLYVLPGGVDPDCRLLNPSDEVPMTEDFRTGSGASLLGGTTTIINEITVRPGLSITDAYARHRGILDAECCCDFALILSVPHFSPGIADEMKSLAADKKIVSFSFRLLSGKSATAPFAFGLEEEVLMMAMDHCSTLGIPPSVPVCGNPAVLNKVAESVFSSGFTGPEGCLLASPERFEADTVTRVGLLAATANCPVIFTRIHSLAALEALVEQRSLGNVVFGGTSIAAIGCVHAGNTVTHPNWAKAASCVADPPIRPDETVARSLLSHVATGELMAVGSAHRAIASNIRAGLGLNDFRQIPIGQATAGGRLSALWKVGVEKEALLDPCGFVSAISTNPARLYNLYPRKGCIAEGSDADIVIWNPESKDAAKSLVPDGVEDPFEGLNCFTCRPEVVLLRGKVVVRQGELVETSEPTGRFVHSKGSSGMVFSRTTALRAIGQTLLCPVTREPYSGPVVDLDSARHQTSPPRESHFYRKSDFDNVPKEALPPGKRAIHTSVRTAQPPGGVSKSFWWNK
ncbi:Dihydropyrimidinase-related protein 3-A [Taenia crassiceps]|uniref:dihydropyrimidinase n=1 Tax=Taenia crassiceps TaxID=6207 RepID=A0ABR4QM75_9CEST